MDIVDNNKHVIFDSFYFRKLELYEKGDFNNANIILEELDGQYCLCKLKFIGNIPKEFKKKFPDNVRGIFDENGKTIVSIID